MSEHKIEYRVVRHKDGKCSVQEVYFDDKSKPYAHTIDLQIEGKSINEIREQLQSMLWS